jgi:hypothetical protein
MSLRVAFDLDGTVADMYSALRREAEALFGESLPAPGGPSATEAPAGGPPPDTSVAPAVAALHLTAWQQIRLWDRVRLIENFWTTLPEIEPGIIDRIARTASTRRWEVLFITTRPPTAGEPTQLQSQRWLDAHGFRFPSVDVVHRSRGRLADALQLDAVVDDRPENCLDVAVESQARPVLIWHGSLSEVPKGAKRLGVKVVSSISDAVTFLERLDDRRQEPRVVRSIRRLLRRDPVP